MAFFISLFVSVPNSSSWLTGLVLCRYIGLLLAIISTMAIGSSMSFWTLFGFVLIKYRHKFRHYEEGSLLTSTSDRRISLPIPPIASNAVPNSKADQSHTGFNARLRETWIWRRGVFIFKKSYLVGWRHYMYETSLLLYHLRGMALTKNYSGRWRNRQFRSVCFCAGHSRHSVGCT